MDIDLQNYMESNIQRLRVYYGDFRQAAYANDTKQISGEKLKNCRSIIAAQKNHINQTGDFATIQQTTYYQEKFNQMIKLMSKAKKSGLPKSQYLSELKQILKDQRYMFNNSYLKKETTNEEINKPPPLQNQLISQFFESKKSKLVPDTGFKSVLESAPVMHRSFKKKTTVSHLPTVQPIIEEKSLEDFKKSNEDYKKVMNENLQLKKKLQEKQRQEIEERNRDWNRQPSRQPSSHRDSESEYRISNRLRQLEQENNRLSRENTKLRSEKSVTVYTINPQINQQNMGAYNLQTRENDLYKINVRNSNESSSHQNCFDGLSDHNRVDAVQAYETKSQYGNKMDSFSMSHSIFSQRQQISSISMNMGIRSLRTITKNKTAFFKNKMMLSKDHDFEIGFKKSSLEGNYDRIRIIFYVNNKTPQARTAKINYEYESDYYEIQVKEQLNYIGGLKQARQVIQIRLKSSFDINSIIEAQFDLADKQYNLWVPVVFLQFQEPKLNKASRKLVKKTIHPNKQFGSSQKATQVLTWMKVLLKEGQMWAKSKFEEGPIYLKWTEENRLEVETTEKWIDVLTFIFFDYQP